MGLPKSTIKGWKMSSPISRNFYNTGMMVNTKACIHPASLQYIRLLLGDEHWNIVEAPQSSRKLLLNASIPCGGGGQWPRLCVIRRISSNCMMISIHSGIKNLWWSCLRTWYGGNKWQLSSYFIPVQFLSYIYIQTDSLTLRLALHRASLLIAQTTFWIRLSN